VTDKKLKPLPKRAAEIDEAKAWFWRALLATKWQIPDACGDPRTRSKTPLQHVFELRSTDTHAICHSA
jgi:hypothetical protein